MSNKLSSFAFLILTATSLTGVQANFDVVNHSSETIVVSVLTTEVFGRGHVNQFETVTLYPGQHHDFITNDVVSGRTVSLSIYSQQAQQNYFDKYNPGSTVNWGTHNGRVQWTPYWPKAHKKMGNKYVAQQAAAGNFTPLVNSHGGSHPVKAVQVVPVNGGKKGVRVWYNGFQNNIEFKAW